MKIKKIQNKKINFRERNYREFINLIKIYKIKSLRVLFIRKFLLKFTVIIYKVFTIFG